MSQTNWEADKMLDVYIYDYLVKRKLLGSAKAFQAEGKVSTDPVAIDAPGGFLLEWWSVFWDIFIARTNEKHSEPAASYIEMMKARELQQQQQTKPQQPIQMQHLLMQRQMQQQQQQHQQLQQQQQQHQQLQQQQQRRDGTQILNGAVSGLVGNDALLRQNPATANALAAKIFEERSKLPSSDDAAVKQRLGENAGQRLDPNHASMLKSSAVGGQPSGQTLHGTSGRISGNLQQLQNRNQQLHASTQDIKSEMNPMISSRAGGPEGSLIGVHGPSNQSNIPSGSSQGGHNLTLKGWPLADQLRPGFLQPKSLMQSPEALNQLQLLQNLQSPSSSEDINRLRMLLNNRNMGLPRDGSVNSVGDIVPNVGSSMQVPSLSRSDAETLMKLQQQQLQNNNQQQYLQNRLPSQQSQSSNSHIQQDKTISSGSLNVDGNMLNTFQGNDQASKSQIMRKRKQPGSSSGPANSSGTANTAGPSPSSPSTPSTHTPGDVMSMPTMPRTGSSKSLLMYSSDNLGSMASAPNQLAQQLQADVDRFVDDGALEDNVDSFLSHEEQDPRDRVGRCGDVGKGFLFKEIQHISASTNKVESCHFSSDGKLLATGGHDKKAVLWCTESFKMKSTLEEHSQWITDVRFSNSMSRLATSSADKTVRVWDADKPAYSLRTFTGHSTSVMSLDFHPCKDDIVCSCDNNGEIRYWSIKNGSCAGFFKGGSKQVRFQPRLGRLLAAAGDNIVSILDVETQACRLKLQGHKSQVHSVCWDPSGEYLASVSDDSVRVWTVGSGSKAEVVHELSFTGNKYNTCVFHPAFSSLLIIGCYENLELWNMSENKTMSLPAHEKLISGLAVSHVSGLVASASHDKYVKIWK